MDCELKHALSLLSSLNKLRTESVLCDVEIKVLNVKFQAHRVLLCAASEYFQVMFCGGMAESSQRVIQLNEVSPKIIALLLDFIYTGKIPVNSTNVQELLGAAKMLQVDSVVESCCEFLTKELTPSNCLGILLFSDLHSCNNLYNIVLNYVQRNFIDVIRNEEFLQLDIKTLLLFIKSDDIKINQEEDVLSAVINWILYDVSSRCLTNIVGELFLHIRLHLLTPECVDNHLKKIADVTIRKRLYKLYQDTLKTQQLSGNLLPMCARSYAQQYFYVIGGYTRRSDSRWNEVVSLAEVERCNASSETYISGSNVTTTIQLSPMNHARNGLGIAVLNGLIYAIGGERDSLIYDSVECFNPVLNKWSLVASMVSPRAGLGACVVEDEIFVIGGWIGSEIAKTIEKYNPNDDCWVVVGNILTPRYNAGVCEMNGLIYTVGGMDDSGEELQSGDVYDTVRERWMNIAPMHHKRSCVSLVSLHGFIYAIGGCTGSDGGSNIVERYNVVRNIWEDVESMPSVRVSASAIHYGDCIYVFGGRTLDYPPEILDSIDYYDTTRNKWFSFGMMQLKRSEAGVAVL